MNIPIVRISIPTHIAARVKAEINGIFLNEAKWKHPIFQAKPSSAIREMFCLFVL